MREHRVFAAVYDRLTAPMERRVLGEQRRRLLARARGRVLEVGAGTGANLSHYPREGVASLELAEPDAAMRRRLERRLTQEPLPFPVTISDATAEGPHAGAPYDTIVATLVLCTVPDPVAAARALATSLVPEGRFLYLEHVAAGGVAQVAQRALRRPWAVAAAGCRLDRDTTIDLRLGGLVVVEQDWLVLPLPLARATVGVAQPRLRDGAVTPAPAPRATRSR